MRILSDRNNLPMLDMTFLVDLQKVLSIHGLLTASYYVGLPGASVKKKMFYCGIIQIQATVTVQASSWIQLLVVNRFKVFGEKTYFDSTGSRTVFQHSRFLNGDFLRVVTLVTM